MEAWIKVYHDLSDHPKVYALAEALKIEQFSAVGLVVSLWIWTLLHAPDGDLGRFPDAAIARACHWNKPAAGLVKALQECGLLDGKHVHDWEDYAGALLKAESTRKEKNRKRVGEYRERKRLEDALQSDTCNDGVTHCTSITDGITDNVTDSITGGITETVTDDITDGVTDGEHNDTCNDGVRKCNAPRREEKRIYIEDEEERGRARTRARACAREEELHDYEHSRIGTLVSTCLKSMTPRAWDELYDYMQDLPEDLIAWAVQTSCEHGGNNWSYVRKVLGGLSTAGIKTVEEAEKRSEEHRKKRSQRQQTGKPSNIAQLNYSQREYPEQKPGELPDWYIRMLEDEQKADAAKKAGVQPEMPEWLAEMMIEETQNAAD